MHNAFITIEHKKVSKSLGNTVYLHQIIERGYSPRSLRYWYLTGHYRSPMNFTWEGIEGAHQALQRLTRTYLELPQTKDAASEQFIRDFRAALAHDLDTPRALARTWEMLKDSTLAPGVKRASLLWADKVLGLGLGDARPTASLKVVTQSDLPYEVQTWVEEREAARKNKDFTKADELRAQIERAGFELADSPEGPIVKRI
jgi:cysteinyl-tRNA synthetase